MIRLGCVRCAAVALVRRVMSETRTAAYPNQRPLVGALPRTATVAVPGLRTIGSAELLHLLYLAPRVFAGSNFEWQAPRLVDKQAEDNCAWDSE